MFFSDGSLDKGELRTDVVLAPRFGGLGPGKGLGDHQDLIASLRREVDSCREEARAGSRSKSEIRCVTAGGGGGA